MDRDRSLDPLDELELLELEDDRDEWDSEESLSSELSLLDLLERFSAININGLALLNKLYELKKTYKTCLFIPSFEGENELFQRAVKCLKFRQ